ncbi:MAG: DUF3368 domain-containing protein [Bacteroidota bacterium]
MIVISDTSPISNLIELGYIHLLPELFQQVIIPSEVVEEPEENQDPLFLKELLAIQEAGWLQVRTPKSNTLPSSVQDIPLDSGETAAIALALELGANVLLIDERAGYQVAQNLQIQTLGLLGVLLQAKESGRIDTIKPLVDQLRDEIGFWIGQSLYERVIELAGETD